MERRKTKDVYQTVHSDVVLSHWIPVPYLKKLLPFLHVQRHKQGVWDQELNRYRNGTNS